MKNIYHIMAIASFTILGFFQSVGALAINEIQHYFKRADSTILLEETGQKHQIFKLSHHYFVLPPQPVNYFTNGQIVALTHGPRVLRATLTSGQIPAGMTLTPNGVLLVNNSGLLHVGNYPLVIEIFDERQQVQKDTIKISILEQGVANRNATFSLRKQKYIYEYKDEEVLATAIDPDGRIIDAISISKLPQGISLSQQGSLVVSEAKRLQSGTYNFWVATADEKKGVTLFVITLSLLPEN